MLYSEFQLQVSDGIKLFAREWKAENTQKGVLCLVHGLGEHSGRYAHVAEIVTSSGYSMLAFDLRGHGMSHGKPGHAVSYDILMDDIGILIDEASRRFPGHPCFLYGHSMGGNLVLNYALRRKPYLTGVIATSPWLRLATAPPSAAVMLAKLLDIIYPSFTQSNRLQPSDLCHESGTV